MARDLGEYCWRFTCRGRRSSVASNEYRKCAADSATALGSRGVRSSGLQQLEGASGVLEGAVGDEPQAPASRVRRMARVAFMVCPVPKTSVAVTVPHRHQSVNGGAKPGEAGGNFDRVFETGGWSTTMVREVSALPRIYCACGPGSDRRATDCARRKTRSRSSRMCASWARSSSARRELQGSWLSVRSVRALRNGD